MQALRDFFTQVQMIKQQAMPPQPAQASPETNPSQLPPTQPPQAPVGPASNVAV